MSELDRAIGNFIEFEAHINNANETEKALYEKFDQLKNASSSYSSDEATRIYNAHSQILDHKKEVEKFNEKLREAEKVIKSHLELLDNGTITHTYSSHRNNMGPYKTYVFSLVNGAVKHNKQ